MKKIYLFGALLATFNLANAQSSAPSTTVVISQFYGAGGNTNAIYNRDYVELYNLSNSTVDISGWTIQYQSATNVANPWNFNTIPAGQTIAPGKYYLIAFGAAGANGAALPVTPDFDSTTTPLNLSGTTGRLALVSSGTALPAGCSSSNIVDNVSYGSTAVCFEGTGPAPSTSSILADFRLGNGATDTNNNNNDFEAKTPSPRNSSTTLSVDQNNISGLSVFPNPAKQFLNITSASFAEKQVVLYDVLGKVALTAKVTNQSLNIASLPKGVYVAKITEEGKVATRKVVIE